MWQRAIRFAVQYQAEIQNWRLMAECQSMLEGYTWNYVQHNCSAIDDLFSIVNQIYADYLIVTAALDPKHPDFHHAWTVIHNIVNTSYSISYWLRQHQDSVYMDDHAPDMRVINDLHQHLAEFRFQSQLKTYIQIIATRAVNEWVRSQAALKRGGTGINPDGKASFGKRYNSCYLSDVYSTAHDRVVEEFLFSTEPEPAQQAEDGALIEYVGQAIMTTMADDPQVSIIRKIWRALFFEKVNITELAYQLGMRPCELFNLKGRIARRLKPAVLLWLDR